MRRGFRKIILAGQRLLASTSALPPFRRLLSVQTARKLSNVASDDADQPETPRQLLVDVSTIAQNDAGTGIQRVVREILKQLLENPPSGYEVRPVHASRSHAYRYADRYRSSLMGGAPGNAPSRPVRVRSGDVFLALDLTSHILPRRHFQISRWKARGARIYFTIYDLLPVLRPEWFIPAEVKAHENWLRSMAIYADGAICISRSVSNELKRWLKNQYGELEPPVTVGWFHLGSDTFSSIPDSYQRNAVPLLVRLRTGSFILMTGTLEPRKGYAQALSAFELLWSRGKNVNLVIVGRPGWKVDALLRRLREHPEAGKRVHWLESASDHMLRDLYAASDGLLMTSEGEGFGLPLIEAACYGKPILARNIPVFREVAGDHARYFSGNTPEGLAAEIGEWLELIKRNQAITSTGIRPQSWRESAEQLLSNIGPLKVPAGR